MKKLKLLRLKILALICIIPMATYAMHGEYKIIEKSISRGMRTVKNRQISAIIVHSTFNNSGGDKYDINLILKQFSRYGVSAHYVIARDGSIYRLVNERNVSFHAGKSKLPNGKSNLNAKSIGIELMTSFDEAPTNQQIQKLALLVNDICKRHKIEYILRHSDVAPDRKTDPWNMNWEAFLPMIEQYGALTKATIKKQNE